MRELFEPQKYPDMGDDTPYDAAGWTLPFQMDVNVVEGKSPLADDIRAALTLAPWHAGRLAHRPDGAVHDERRSGGHRPRAGRDHGNGRRSVARSRAEQLVPLINRALAAGASLRFAPASGTRGARYVVTGLDAAKADAWAKELWVTAERTLVTAGRHEFADAHRAVQIAAGRDGRGMDGVAVRHLQREVHAHHARPICAAGILAASST